MAKHQDLPASGEEREQLREKGQFWTPNWVADAMVAYVLGGGAKEVLDPAVGAGAFLSAAMREEARINRKVRKWGCELHGEILQEAAANGIPKKVIDDIRLADFILDPPQRTYPAIVANPPYIRHHRIDAEQKERLQALAQESIGKTLDGRTGYHIFFLIRALTLLAPGGRLAFIMPADTCEGVFASDLWNWISKSFKIEGTVVFSPEATPFPGVDTNAVIFLIENSTPGRSIKWIRCNAPDTPSLRTALANLGRARSSKNLEVTKRSLDEAIQTGLSRPFVAAFRQDAQLGSVARTVRGIATGANEFFFMTKAQADERGIPQDYLVRAVGRTRDAQNEVLTTAALDELDAAGTPTYLLSTGPKELDELPQSIREYIAEGEKLGLPERALIKARRHWYRTEERAVPPFLFAYLGRRNARFIRNESGAVPLTGFLCIYPRDESIDLEALWEVLQASATHDRLASVGKSYGGGAIKVEPRALERLPLDAKSIMNSGLRVESEQAQLALAA